MENKLEFYKKLEAEIIKRAESINERTIKGDTGALNSLSNAAMALSELSKLIEKESK